MSKPGLIAVVGKSCSGKNTYVKYLHEPFWISDTTRPPRIGEIDGVDYNFITNCEFANRVAKNKYLEFTNFRNWFYGHNKDSLSKEGWNVGIFDPKGILNILENYSDEFDFIVVYYLKVNFIERLRRSFYREHQWKLEYFRRLIVDFINFINLEKELAKYKNLKNYLYFVRD